MIGIDYVLKKIFGSKEERDFKRYKPQIDFIASLEPEMQKLSDSELPLITEKLRRRLVEGETLEEVLPEAFALVRESGRRFLGMRHFDVQLMGGMVLFEGKISEMATGEGKTLVATLPAYLIALEGKGVHIVTVNDYLAKRDKEWMGPIFEKLGLTTGSISHDMEPEERRKSYNADITYVTNNELGFDYLRDNMAWSMEDCVQQRGLHYGIVDEVDSILIDEARTPLIISGPAEDSTEKYYVINNIIPRLRKDVDYKVDEKDRNVMLTEEGGEKAQKLLALDNLFSEENLPLVHHIHQAIRAHTLYQLDRDYVIQEGEVIIVDEFTGRLMPGRRWSDGLHQAVEAKEGVKIERENQTLATITFQNLFRMYKRLAGMTGTAYTEATEFGEIYKLEVVVIPTNRQLIRVSSPDQVYKTEREKYDAVVEEIAEHYHLRRPVLVGTTSVEKSERLDLLLRKRGIPHSVLNAKFHQKEAEIVAQAGRLGAITIATNMAGRGTDILLGGNPKGSIKNYLKKADPEGEATPEELAAALQAAKAECDKQHDEVIALGGLHILGTERHEARRIDNQLRGRAGRQGDPGSSRFYLALDDDLMRIFGGDRIQRLASRFGMKEGEVLEHGMVSRAIESAQKKVENHNFEIRKQLLKYDNVMGKQREVIYETRRDLLIGADPEEALWEMAENSLDRIIDSNLPDSEHPSQWEWDTLPDHVRDLFGLEFDPKPYQERDVGRRQGEALRDEISATLLEAAKARFAERKQFLGEEEYNQMMRFMMLRTIDSRWKEHLYTMDHLKENIGLRGYAQKDPLVEYEHDAYELFQQMYEGIEREVTSLVFRVELLATTPDGRKVKRVMAPPKRQPILAGSSDAKAKPRRTTKIGRNDPCPCGSGKKYKKCCALKTKDSK